MGADVSVYVCVCVGVCVCGVYMCVYECVRCICVYVCVQVGGLISECICVFLLLSLSSIPDKHRLQSAFSVPLCL